MTAPVSGADAKQCSLHLLDAARRTQHCFLEAGDCCRYLWEYRPGLPRNRAQRWISDLKCRPSQAAARPLRAIYKECALLRAAQALRAAAPRAWVEQASWCPIPPSARAGASDYDDRLLRLLRLAFAGYDVDIRPLLRQSQSLPADHCGRQRVAFAALYEAMTVDTSQLLSCTLRMEVVLFDDVLTTGKHLKCAQLRLRERLGPLSISACVLARRVLVAKRRGVVGAS
ncbi:MAG TPA: hypothetical protein VMF64_17260 [Steroidobacteraceae bacterium]|nr:hypothetical protein [Steroidobacteraceae bacterium]